MLQNIIINQVKNIIKKGIERFAKEMNVNPDRLALWITFSECGRPKLSVLCDFKQAKSIEFAELVTKMERITYLGMGFDVSKDIEKWMLKFMIRVSDEKSIPIAAPSYYLAVKNKEVVALMFLNNKKAIFFPDADDSIDSLAKYKISIDYILNTK